MIYRYQEQRCFHGYCQTGPHGVKCPECTGDISAAAPRVCGLLRVGRLYASCELLAQEKHTLTVRCGFCDQPARITKSTILRAHRCGIQWRCPNCRDHFRRPQVNSSRVRATKETE